MRLPPPAAAQMSRQHGVISRRQLIAWGCSADAVDSMARRGLLEVAARGVYRFPGGARPPEQQVMTAVLRCGPAARAAGKTACALHGLEGFSLNDSVHIVVPANREVREVGFHVCRAAVPFRDQATVRGIPAVKVEAALAQAAPQLSQRGLRVAIDSARRNGKLTLESLERHARTRPRSAGSRVLLPLLAKGVLEPETEGERALAALTSGSSLRLEWGQLLLPGIRVDAADREALLVLEYDGRRFHALGSDRAYDRHRQRLLEEHGWRVERITWDMIRLAPEQTLARLERIRAERVAMLRANRRG